MKRGNWNGFLRNVFSRESLTVEKESKQISDMRTWDTRREGKRPASKRRAKVSFSPSSVSHHLMRVHFHFFLTFTQCFISHYYRTLTLETVRWQLSNFYFVTTSSFFARCNCNICRRRSCAKNICSLKIPGISIQHFMALKVKVTVSLLIL